MALSRVQKARGAATWLVGRGAELPEGTVVVSPHLDDAVFSVGAALASAARRGRRPTVLTVFAGDPASETPAGEWDRASGFATAGEAALARREEDRRACEVLGVEPLWLSFSDHQYARGGDETAVAGAVAEAAERAGCSILLVPGFPLAHEDHAWLAAALEGAELPIERVGRYVEQPYAAERGELPLDPGWQPARATLRDRRTKLRAWREYASQEGVLGPTAERRTLRFEAARGGERVAL